MGNTITKNNQKEKNKISKLLNRIEAMPDVRVGETQAFTNRVRRFIDSISKGISKLVISNIIFLLFLAPTLVLFLYYMPKEINELTKGFVQTSDFGFGLSTGGNQYNLALIEIYKFQIKMAIYLLPCFFFGFLGYSGLFFVSRNSIWGVPIKPFRHFLRGFKNYSYKFIPYSLIMSGLISLAMYSASSAQINLVNKVSPAPMITLCVFTCIFGLLTFIFSQIYFPMMVAYKFNFKQRVKNTFYLIILNLPQVLLVNLIIILPMFLLFLKFVNIILAIIFLTVGFIAQTNIFSLLANFTFDNYIRPINKINEKRNLINKINEKKKEKIKTQKEAEKKQEKPKKRIEIISKEEAENKEALEKEKRRQKYIEKQKRKKK